MRSTAKTCNWHCSECHADGGCNLCLTRPKIWHFIRTRAPIKTGNAHKNGQPNGRSINRDSASNRRVSDQPRTAASQRFKSLWRHWNTRMAGHLPLMRPFASDRRLCQAGFGAYGWQLGFLTLCGRPNNSSDDVAVKQLRYFSIIKPGNLT